MSGYHESAEGAFDFVKKFVRKSDFLKARESNRFRVLASWSGPLTKTLWGKHNNIDLQFKCNMLHLNSTAVAVDAKIQSDFGGIGIERPR